MYQDARNLLLALSPVSCGAIARGGVYGISGFDPGAALGSPAQNVLKFASVGL
jgi:hypothetical protein